VYTPTVTVTPRQVHKDVTLASTWLSRVIDQADEDHDSLQPTLPRRNNTELLIVDEADRLKMQALETLRDHFDRSGTGLVLIGMPGIERRLARHPQLYSRVGFAHEYRTLSSDELAFVLEHHYRRLGLTLSADDFTDAEAIAAVARITGGNFRLVHRLFAQITRILDINNLSTITTEVVDTARQNLVIGVP
jgi:DNA transposition AAA+ family ATPase